MSDSPNRPPAMPRVDIDQSEATVVERRRALRAAERLFKSAIEEMYQPTEDPPHPDGSRGELHPRLDGKYTSFEVVFGATEDHFLSGRGDGSDVREHDEVRVVELESRVEDYPEFSATYRITETTPRGRFLFWKWPMKSRTWQVRINIDELAEAETVIIGNPAGEFVE